MEPRFQHAPRRANFSFVRSLLLRQAWEVDLVPEEGCNSPSTCTWPWRWTPGLAWPSEDEVPSSLPDAEGPQGRVRRFPEHFSELPPLHGPDLLRLAIDLAGVGEVELHCGVLRHRRLRLGDGSGRATDHHRRPPAGLA